MRDITIRPEDYSDGLRLGAGRFGSGDTLSVREGVEWASETVAILGRPLGGSGFLGDLDMRIDGMVVAEGTAIDLWSQVSEVQDSDIRIGTAGLVGGVRNGIALKGGSGDEILNQGIVAGTRAAIAAGGDDLRIENTGLVLTFGNEIEEAPRYHAISITHGDATIRNEGAILGVDLGLRASEQAVIRVNSDARLELRNSDDGLIHTEEGTSVWGGSQADAVINRGAIWGDVVLNGGDDVVRNRGTIGGEMEGATIASDLVLGSGDDFVRNQGVVMGAIELGSGDDRFEGWGGSSAGDVRGGTGDDTYVLGPDADVRIRERDGEGYDTVFSSDNHRMAQHVERLVLQQRQDTRGIGNDEDNLIEGNWGDDRLSGRRGDDRIEGGRGDDDITGGRGRDDLIGDRGGDELRGGRGKDVLDGGRGADWLEGGTGGDKLSGGRGADTFVWTEVGDAGTSRTQRDVVRDLDAGWDALDFAELDLLWQDGSFSGERAEIRAYDDGGDTVLKVDADGDARTDMKVILRGVTGLGEDDLML